MFYCKVSQDKSDLICSQSISSALLFESRGKSTIKEWGKVSNVQKLMSAVCLLSRRQDIFKNWLFKNIGTTC